jgi:hypothetical protein
MGKETETGAVEVVRRIRDEHAKLLRDKSNKEIIEFFRSTAEAFRKRTRTKGRGTANKRMQPSARKARRG